MKKEVILIPEILKEDQLKLLQEVTPESEFIITNKNDVSDEMLEKCGFLNDLKKNGFEPALKKCDLSGIGDGAKDALFTVASGLGKSPKQDQIRLCDSALSELERDLQKERDMLQGKLKIVRTVTLTAAMMAVIILV